MDLNNLKNQIINESSKLAFKLNQEEDFVGITTLEDCEKEYTEQMEDGSYLIWLRSWIGNLVEQRNQTAIQIMKNIIRYKLKLV